MRTASKTRPPRTTTRVHLSGTFRGNYRLDGQLDAVGGTEVATELRRIEKELFEVDWAQAKAVHGDNATVDHLARTPGQRRADALREMARRSAAKLPDAKEPRPLFVVHLGEDSLRRLCELASGTVITPGQLVPLITQADIERIVYAGTTRRITEIGARTRFFDGPLRRAIQLRDRRCQHPGCDVPAEDCDIDHHIPYSKGGLTSQGNGKAECGTHNRHKSDTLPDDYNPYDHDYNPYDHDHDPDGPSPPSPDTG
jgi:hypothetical protein